MKCLLLDIPKTLYQFFVEARNLRLEGLHADDHLHNRPSTKIELNNEDGKALNCVKGLPGINGGENEAALSSFAMKKKKQHEVCLFSELIAKEMFRSGINQVRYQFCLLICA